VIKRRSAVIKRLTEIGAYRGLRHARPPGQRPADEDERAHAQGPKKTVGRGKRRR
jgi:ribosomal protein S13